MGFKCGIVGLPNVGTSTIFNALTNAGAEAANFPFCTKDPNLGIVSVPDERIAPLVNVYAPKKTIPTIMNFVDIAGLVKGASKGEGLGNQFLSHIKEADAIMHVVRCFEDVDVTHVEEVLDPVRDAGLIMMELILKDMQLLKSCMDQEKKLASTGNKDARIRLAGFEKIWEQLNREKPASSAELTDAEKVFISELQLLTMKPMFYCANIREDELHTGSEHLENLKKYVQDTGCDLLAISGKIESEISELEEDEKTEFLKDLGLKESGLNQVIRKGYELLGLQTFFTAGEKEVRAWTIRKAAKAPQAAGAIHSDFEKGFIRAETLSYSDFLDAGSWNGAKDKGLVRTEGKEYDVQDGDIMHFLFNV
jgi:GTP-binding protein YchF